MTKNIDVLRPYLPDSILYLVTVISLNSALILVKNYGGGYIEVPTTAKPSHPVAKLIGMDDWGTLCQLYASTRLEISRCDGLVRMERNLSILNDNKAGMAKTKIAVKHNITDRQARRILKTMYQLEKQGQIEPLQAALKSLLNG